MKKNLGTPSCSQNKTLKEVYPWTLTEGKNLTLSQKFISMSFVLYGTISYKIYWQLFINPFCLFASAFTFKRKENHLPVTVLTPPKDGEAVEDPDVLAFLFFKASAL